MPLGLVVPPGYSIDRLDTTLHDRAGFNCGTESLDAYLETQASQSQDKNNATTHVLIETDSSVVGIRPIVGYATLTPSELPLLDAHKALKKLGKSTTKLRAQLIARMAVDHRHQSKGLGVFLLRYALKCCWDIHLLSAFHVVLVDPKDEKLKAFYIKHGGFLELPDAPLRLYIPIATVGKLLSN